MLLLLHEDDDDHDDDDDLDDDCEYSLIVVHFLKVFGDLGGLMGILIWVQRVSGQGFSGHHKLQQYKYLDSHFQELGWGVGGAGGHFLRGLLIQHCC